VADGHDEGNELGLLKLADYAIVAQAIARQAKCIWTKRSERIKDAALKGGATKARLAKERGSSARPMQEEERFLTCAGRRFRRSESERKSRPAAE